MQKQGHLACTFWPTLTHMLVLWCGMVIYLRCAQRVEGTGQKVGGWSSASCLSEAETSSGGQIEPSDTTVLSKHLDLTQDVEQQVNSRSCLCSKSLKLRGLYHLIQRIQLRMTFDFEHLHSVLNSISFTNSNKHKTKLQWFCAKRC